MTTTTTNTGAASLSDEQIEKGWRDTFSTDNPYCPCNLKSFTKAVRWAERHIAATPQADAARHPNDDTPKDDACEAALDRLGDNRGQGLDPFWKMAFRNGWHEARTAIAAVGAQEAVAWKVDGLNGHNESAPGVWLKKVNADAAAAMLFKSSATPLYAAPLPREAATVPLTDGWISVNDRLPADETPVLIILRGEIAIGELRWENPSHEETYQPFRYWDNPSDDGQDWQWHDVMYWMPLPIAPKEPA